MPSTLKSRMEPRISMVRRGETPGLKYGRNRQPYWMAKQIMPDPLDFPEPCVPLPREASRETLIELCRGYTAQLDVWIEGRLKDQPRLTRTIYNGTVFSACRIYQEHPYSRFNKVKGNSRKTYTDNLTIIENTVGKRLIRNLTVFDVEHWYDEWRKPELVDGKEAIDAPERITRAHGAVAMFRTVIRFCAALRHNDCKNLADELSKWKFEKAGAREAEMTYAYASAFIRTAMEFAQNGKMPRSRALYLAIGVAAQFEMMLRQMDVIGEWTKRQIDATKAVRKGATLIRSGEDDYWTGWFTWERIPGWHWRMKTSKSKYRAAADFRLDNYGLLFPLLELVPHDERTGAIVKGEHDLPIRAKSYRRWFREIARAAEIPDTIWIMDARAGGATEADDAGAHLEDIKTAMTHSKTDTTLRYIRRSGRKIASVAEARAKLREVDGKA